MGQMERGVKGQGQMSTTMDEGEGGKDKDRKRKREGKRGAREESIGSCPIGRDTLSYEYRTFGYKHTIGRNMDTCVFVHKIGNSLESISI